MCEKWMNERIKGISKEGKVERRERKKKDTEKLI
jgi:hypothetical protein